MVRRPRLAGRGRARKAGARTEGRHAQVPLAPPGNPCALVPNVSRPPRAAFGGLWFGIPAWGVGGSPFTPRHSPSLLCKGHEEATALVGRSGARRPMGPGRGPARASGRRGQPA